MRQYTYEKLKLYDFAPEPEQIRDSVLQGLMKPRKELPSKLFYDRLGSLLFEEITRQEDYYSTRTELNIMKLYGDEITGILGKNCLLIEYGSGSSLKTRILLDRLINPAGYMPVEISKEHLMIASRTLSEQYPHLEILPVCADYTGNFALPAPTHQVDRRVVYFPGSTIGNFDPDPARNFLKHIAQVVGEKGGLLIGVDLKKDPEILHRAYNDAKGVTARFNINMLARLNRELGTNFNPDRFAHYAFYNPTENRIEMHLVSLDEQSIMLNGTKIPFYQGESIWTESSYKFTLAEFARLAGDAGFRVVKVWTDNRQLFSVQYLIPV